MSSTVHNGRLSGWLVSFGGLWLSTRSGKKQDNYIQLLAAPSCIQQTINNINRQYTTQQIINQSLFQVFGPPRIGEHEETTDRISTIITHYYFQFLAARSCIQKEFKNTKQRQTTIQNQKQIIIFSFWKPARAYWKGLNNTKKRHTHINTKTTHIFKFLVARSSIPKHIKQHKKRQPTTHHQQLSFPVFGRRALVGPGAIPEKP